MPAPNWTEEDLARLREMRANGDSLRFIAKELKRHIGLLRSQAVGRQIAADPSALKKQKKSRSWLRPVPLPPFEMLHLPLVELDGPQCHFPLGDRGSFTFCGHETGGGTYCEFHASVAYRRSA